MARKKIKDDKKGTAIYIDRPTKAKLDELSAKTDFSRVKILQKALAMFSQSVGFTA